jgi:hypothetical protein
MNSSRSAKFDLSQKGLKTFPQRSAEQNFDLAVFLLADP